MKHPMITIAALIGGIIGEFLGGWDGFITCLFFFVITDYLTGVLSSAKQGKLSSSIGFWGILKKVLIFLVVSLGVMMDQNLSGEPLRTAIIFFYIANEGISILENLKNLGVPIPKVLAKFLEKIEE